MKKIFLVLIMVLFSLPLFAQFGQKTGTFKTTNDTTSVSKKFGRAYFFEGDSLYYVGFDTYLKQIATEGDTISLAKLYLDTLAGRSSDSVFAAADMIFLQDVLVKLTTGEQMEVWGNKSTDTLLSVYNDRTGLTARDSSFVVLSTGAVVGTNSATFGATATPMQILTTGDIRSTSTAGHRLRMDGFSAFDQTKSLLLENQTAATVGSQKPSPAFELRGNGWKTDATAGSDSVKWGIYNLPVQGTSAPTSRLIFASKVGSAVWNNQMFFQSNGYVGIGAAPNYALDVTGVVNASSYIQSALGFHFGNSVRSLISTMLAGGGASQITYMSGSGAYTGGKHTFITDDVTTLTITGGNLGIGTSAPGSKLEVYGNKSTDTLLSVYNDKTGLTARDSSFVVLPTGGLRVSTTAAGIGLSIDGNKTTGKLAQFINDNDGAVGDSAVTITSAGRLNVYSGSIQAGYLTSLALGLSDGNYEIAYSGGATTYSHFYNSRFTHWNSNNFGDVFFFGGSNATKYLTGTNLEQSLVYMNAQINQSATASYNVLKVNVTETAVGSGGGNIVNFGIGGAAKFILNRLGDVGIGTTVPVSNSLTLGTKGTQRDLVITRSYDTTVADSSLRAYILAGNGRYVAKATDADSAALTVDADSARLISNNPWSIAGATKFWNGVSAPTLSLSGQLTSTLAIGTSPFSVTSTTVNTNLNADLLDGESASAFQDDDATLTALAGLTIGTNELIYGTGADAFSMLGVNSTATNKFLRQVSSGAPAWQAIEAGDIPDISGTYQPLHASLTSISGLTEADVSIIEATADNTYNVVTSGGNNYILGSNSANSALEFKAPTGTGSPVLGTSPTLTTSISAASGFSIDITGTGNSYVEIIQDNNAGYLAVGRTTATEPSMLSITDGGADNEQGILQIYNDAGVPLYWFPSTANEFRVRASAPTDDDADGYVIIDIDDGTIGASTQAVNGSTITGTTITDGTMSVTAGAFTAVASMVATGTISGNTLVSLDTDPTYALTAAMCRNAARYNDDADVIDYTLPAAEAGLVVLFYDLAGGVITIDPVDGTDTIYLDGVSVGAGDAIDSPGVVGNYIALMAIDDTRWITIGRSGTWVDGGAD